MTKPLSSAEKAVLQKTINREALRVYTALEGFAKPTGKDNGSKESKTLAIGKEYESKLGSYIQGIMNDDIFDYRQKAIAIERKADELQDEYVSKIDQVASEYNKATQDVAEYLEQEIHAHDQIDPVMQREIEFTSNQLTGQVKTQLMMATDADKVKGIMDNLIKKAKHDPHTARFIVNNGYLFLEKMQSMGGHSDRQSIINRINDAKRMMYTEKQLVLDKALNSVKAMYRSGSDGEQVIRRNRESVKEIAKALREKHEQELEKDYRRRQLKENMSMKISEHWGR